MCIRDSYFSIPQKDCSATMTTPLLHLLRDATDADNADCESDDGLAAVGSYRDAGSSSPAHDTGAVFFSILMRNAGQKKNVANDPSSTLRHADSTAILHP
eukprot:1949858-Alexandrium_andersonii.AAC.1